jgi:hypothetical protein
MSTKKISPPEKESRLVNFSVRLSDSEAARVKAIAEAKDWPLAKVLQKLIIAALDKGLIK